MTRPPSRTFPSWRRQRVRGHERVRALVEGSFAEVTDQLVEVAGHHADLGLRQAGDAERLHQPIHPACGHPEQVAGRDHAGQGCFGAAASLEEPIGEVGALPQLRDRHIQRSDPGVEIAVAVAVAAIRPIGVAGAVGGTAHTVGVRGQQGVDEPAHQLTQQVRAGLRQVLVQELGRVDTGTSGHRCASLRVGCRRFLEESRGDRAYV
jgi:hypothetical protein